MMTQKTIAVFGATGAQGGSVVKFLKEDGTFRVRALTREPSKYLGAADEACEADLDDEVSLTRALKGVYGIFLVTNFWQQGTDEHAQAARAIKAALNAQVEHIVWSTLPDVKSISQGKWDVPHFTNKAQIDALVRSSGLPIFTFVQPPFYFENLVGSMAPMELQEGLKGWSIPINPDSKVIHMGAINEFGKLIKQVFLEPEKCHDKTFSMAAGLYSFNEVAEIFTQTRGEKHQVIQVPHDVYATFYPGAEEIAQMLGYFEDYTYMGPDSQQRIEATNHLIKTPFTSLKEWLHQTT